MPTDHKDDEGSQTVWGNRTMKLQLKRLSRELEDSQEHVKTVAEAKVVWKWIKAIALAITTIAGAVVALKQMGVIN